MKSRVAVSALLRNLTTSMVFCLHRQKGLGSFSLVVLLWLRDGLIELWGAVRNVGRADRGDSVCGQDIRRPWDASSGAASLSQAASHVSSRLPVVDG